MQYLIPIGEILIALIFISAAPSHLAAQANCSESLK